MIIGVSGPHRTGKTTICSNFAAQTGATFVKSNVSFIAKELNVDFNKPMPLRDRLYFQQNILINQIKQLLSLENTKNIYIFDRTPLDFSAYLLAEVNSYSECDSELEDSITKYLQYCVEVSMFFNRIFLTSFDPKIPYDFAEGKPKPNKIYQGHIADLIEVGYSEYQFTTGNNYGNPYINSERDIIRRLGLSV